MSLRKLQPGIEYEIVQDFEDFHGVLFEAGRRMEFVSRNYLPYDDGHTLRFEEDSGLTLKPRKETCIYLQGTDQQEIVDHPARFFSPVPKEA